MVAWTYRLAFLCGAVAALSPSTSPPPPPQPQSQRPLLAPRALPPRAVSSLLYVPKLLRQLLVVDESVRGRDQRALWLRAIAAVHPTIRLAVMLLSVAVACAIWLRPGWEDPDQCIPVGLGPWLGSACRAAVALMAVSIGLTWLGTTAALGIARGMRERHKDRELSEEHLVAAAASAAYERTPENRLRELNTRGVDAIGNWAVDDELSDEDIGVFVNAYQQAVIIAFKGTSSLRDWASNLRRIVPGDEESSETFRRAVATSRRVRDKYMLYRSIQLTGHSRGGGMADFVGRKLGLPSSSFNPATWGKVLRAEEPALRSVTQRTADLVSVLESFFPKDRQVRSRLPKHWPHLLVGPAIGGLCLLMASRARHCCPTGEEPWRVLGRLGAFEGVRISAAAAAVVARWMQKLGKAACILSVLLFMMYEHTVLNFTKR